MNRYMCVISDYNLCNEGNKTGMIETAMVEGGR